MKLMKVAALALGLAIPLAGCADSSGGPFRFAADMPAADADDARALPRLRWSSKAAGPEWTEAAMTALGSHGAALPDIVPADIDAWCPGYRDASEFDRRAFWAGLISALAFHESTHRPAAVGGGGRWYGLTQILPATARGYGCKATTGPALKDGPANLSCAIRIMAYTVGRDGVVSRGMRGVAADWGPFHSRRKREDMRAWVSEQPYCQKPPEAPSLFASLMTKSPALARSPRPTPRPQG